MSGTHATFRALGTEVYLAVRDPADLRRALARARSVLADVDAVASRFRADSDLTAVNAAPGRWVGVDPLLVAAVDAAVAAADVTAGLVSPLLGRSLVALGYDRDFALVERRRSWPDPISPAPSLDAWREIRTDSAGRLRIPAGTALDLGSVGKAWAADLIATAYERELRAGALVSVGGDLRIANPDGHTWAVALSARPGDDAASVVHLDRGGLATSSTRVRRWGRHGARRHHVLDPRTGLPAREVWHWASATGDTCAAANTATTAAVVLGADAPAWLDEHGVSARLVAADGTVRHTGRWPLEERAA